MWCDAWNSCPRKSTTELFGDGSKYLWDLGGIFAGFNTVKARKISEYNKRRFGYSCNGWSSSNFSNGTDDTQYLR